MKLILKLEYAAMFLFSIFLFAQLDFTWWWFLVLILTPDLSLLGYLVNPLVGAWTYNIAHHKGIAIGIYLFGVLIANPAVMLAGVILFGHSNLDRVFDYGLSTQIPFSTPILGC